MNQWVALADPGRAAPVRTWGSATFDSDRGQIRIGVVNTVVMKATTSTPTMSLQTLGLERSGHLKAPSETGIMV